MRILPEICANTTCPFSNFTLNIALGNGSMTVPSSSMASSFPKNYHFLKKSQFNSRPYYLIIDWSGKG